MQTKVERKDIRGAMMDMYTRMWSQTCQSSRVSQMCRISKCSSSPTDELSYSGDNHTVTLRQKTVRI